MEIMDSYTHQTSPSCFLFLLFPFTTTTTTSLNLGSLAHPTSHTSLDGRYVRDPLQRQNNPSMRG